MVHRMKTAVLFRRLIVYKVNIIANIVVDYEQFLFFFRFAESVERSQSPVECKANKQLFQK